MSRRVFIVVCTLYSIAFAVETGFLQINSEPDISIFLNNQFKGNTTSVSGGLILQDVPVGKDYATPFL
jgi:hypothetical protein